MGWAVLYSWFKTLTLHHLERSCYSVARQTIQPDEFLFFDNDSPFSPEEIKATVGKHLDLTKIDFHFEKHGVPTQTASWAQNTAIRRLKHDQFILLRGDMIYDFQFCERVKARHDSEVRLTNRPAFATSWCWQMGYFLGHEEEDTSNHEVDLESLGWRENPQRLLENKNANPFQHTDKDAASFCTSKAAMELGRWYDENLVSWGYWQSQLQFWMSRNSVGICVIPEYLFFHMHHVCERNFAVAQREVEASWKLKGF